MPNETQPSQNTMLQEQNRQIYSSIERIVGMRNYVTNKVDYLLGSAPEESLGEAGDADQPSGIIYSNFEALNILSAAITKLDNQLSRLDQI